MRQTRITSYPRRGKKQCSMHKKRHHTHTHTSVQACFTALLCVQGVCKSQLLLGDHSFAFLFCCLVFSRNLCDVNAVHIEQCLQPFLSQSHCRFCNEVQISLSEKKKLMENKQTVHKGEPHTLPSLLWQMLRKTQAKLWTPCTTISLITISV